MINSLLNISELNLKRGMIEIISVKNAIGDTNLIDPLYAMNTTGIFTK